MNSTLQALIAIRCPRFGMFGRFTITIDGHRVGKVKQETTREFSVEPGTHTVSILLGWRGRPRPLQLTLEPGSRTELIVQKVPGSKQFLKILVGVFPASLIASEIAESLPGKANWWVSFGLSLAVFMALFFTYQLVTAAVSRNYWTFFELKADGTTFKQEQVSSWNDG